MVEGQKLGVFRRDVNATMAAKLFFGGLDEMATNWILSRRRYSLVGEADAIVDLFVGGMRRRPERP
jgi:TetR/AcrR family fatty acid metabolism transcriptional regulator